MNGQRATVISWDAASSRYELRIEGILETRLIKPENVESSVPTPLELDNKGGSLPVLDSKGGTGTEAEPSSDRNPTPPKPLKPKPEPKPKPLKLKSPKPPKPADLPAIKQLKAAIAAQQSISKLKLPRPLKPLKYLNPLKPPKPPKPLKVHWDVVHSASAWCNRQDSDYLFFVSPILQTLGKKLEDQRLQCRQ